MLTGALIGNMILGSRNEKQNEIGKGGKSIKEWVIKLGTSSIELSASTGIFGECYKMHCYPKKLKKESIYPSAPSLIDKRGPIGVIFQFVQE